MLHMHHCQLNHHVHYHHESHHDHYIDCVFFSREGKNAAAADGGSSDADQRD
jgi:hypothetical protein